MAERNNVEENEFNISFNIDDIMQHIGEFGLFQKLLIIVLFISCLPTSYQILMFYFFTITPRWMYKTNSTICTTNGSYPAADLTRCNLPRTEWRYAETKKYSLVTDLDLDCSNEWMLHLATAMTFFGWGTGSLIIGWIGDIYGRLTMFYPSLIGIIVIGFCTAFFQSIYIIMIYRFFIGIAISGTLQQAFVLVCESVDNKHRPLAGLLIYLSLPVGWCILAVKSYLLQDWENTCMACTAPYNSIYSRIM